MGDGAGVRFTWAGVDAAGLATSDFIRSRSPETIAWWTSGTSFQILDLQPENAASRMPLRRTRKAHPRSCEVLGQADDYLESMKLRFEPPREETLAHGGALQGAGKV